MLVFDSLTVRQEDFEAHFRQVEDDFFTLARVDETLADGFVADFKDEIANLVIVHTGAERTEEIDGLAIEGGDEELDVVAGDAISHEDAVGDADTVLKRRGPVELVHTTITHKRRVKSGEIVTGGDDRHARDFDDFVLARELNVRGVVRNVHERRVNHLVVDGVLRGTTHTTGTGVKIVNEEARHLTLLNHVGRLTVTLTHQLGRLTGVTGFKLTSGHDDRRNAELLEDQVRLERLTLTLTTPDTENERHLDLRQVHVVLGDVHDALVHERRRNVEVLRGDVVVLGVVLLAGG